MTEQLRNIRKTALLLLYGADLSGATADEAMENAPQLLARSPDETVGETVDEMPAEDWDEVAARVRRVLERRDEIDEEIRELSPNWRIERMAAVDRNLLRLGIYEILEEITPPLIAINACVELAKEFGTATTPGFINGLLDQLCQNHNIAIDASSRPSG